MGLSGRVESLSAVRYIMAIIYISSSMHNVKQNCNQIIFKYGLGVTPTKRLYQIFGTTNYKFETLRFGSYRITVYQIHPELFPFTNTYKIFFPLNVFCWIFKTWCPPPPKAILYLRLTPFWGFVHKACFL
jgi:hypothetical protein